MTGRAAKLVAEAKSRWMLQEQRATTTADHCDFIDNDTEMLDLGEVTAESPAPSAAESLYDAFDDILTVISKDKNQLIEEHSWNESKSKMPEQTPSIAQANIPPRIERKGLKLWRPFDVDTAADNPVCFEGSFRGQSQARRELFAATNSHGMSLTELCPPPPLSRRGAILSQITESMLPRCSPGFSTNPTDVGKSDTIDQPAITVIPESTAPRGTDGLMKDGLLLEETPVELVPVQVEVVHVDQVDSEAVDIDPELAEVLTKAAEILESTEVPTTAAEIDRGLGEDIASGAEIDSDYTELATTAAEIYRGLGEDIASGAEIDSESTELSTTAAEIDRGLGEDIASGAEIDSDYTELATTAAEIYRGLGKDIASGAEIDSESTELSTTAAEIDRGLGEDIASGAEIDSESTELSTTAAEIDRGLGEDIASGAEIDPESTEVPTAAAEMGTGVRKKIRNEALWKRNIRKEACNTGLQYTSEKGVVRMARMMGDGCKEDCMYGCHSKVTLQDRQSFFNQYWGLKDHTRQWDFLNHYVNFVKPERPEFKDFPQRSAGKYHMVTSAGSMVQVCQTMFLSTLDISEKPVRTAAERLKKKGAAISPDKRGLNPKKKPDFDELVKSIDDHIRSFPTIPAHYCRKDSKRVYLEAGLSLQKMYLLYLDFMKVKDPDMKPALLHRYRHRFLTAFNIGFFVPRNDQCEACNVSLRAPPAIKVKIQDKLQLHLRNKDLARDLRNEDTARAAKDPSVCVAVFDMQKVMLVPKDNTGVNYYKSKVSVHNETFFETSTRKGHCFVWHEGEGKKGANEVASCLIEYTTSYLAAKPSTEEIIFWSDNCYGQNKNKYLFTVCAILSQRFGIKIVMRYMETGHTMSSCDSVHKNIETACKSKSIFTPECWYQVIQKAKVHGEKYEVVRMAGKIVDTHELCDSYLKWDGFGINWKLVREVVFDPNQPQGTVSVRSSLEGDAEVVKINVMKKSKGRPPNLKAYVFKPAYSGPLRLTDRKLYDVGDLCGSLVIPPEFHPFYETLVGFRKIVRNPDLAMDEPPPAEPAAEDDSPSEGLLEGNDQPDLDYGAWFKQQLAEENISLPSLRTGNKDGERKGGKPRGTKRKPAEPREAKAKRPRTKGGKPQKAGGKT